MNIYFNNAPDVLRFLLETVEWQSWEVVKLQMSNSAGVSLILNTKINDPLGQLDYQQLKRLSSLIQTFLNDNANLTINVDIKLRAPKDLKTSIDSAGDYLYFYADFFSQGAISCVSVTQVEKSLTAPSDPVTAWQTFVLNLSNTWQKANNYVNIGQTDISDDSGATNTTGISTNSVAITWIYKPNQYDITNCSDLVILPSGDIAASFNTTSSGVTYIEDLKIDGSKNWSYSDTYGDAMSIGTDPNGYIYIGAGDNGSNDSGKNVIIKVNSNGVSAWRLSYDSTLVSNSHVSSLDSDGVCVWAGAKDGSLNVFDVNNRSVRLSGNSDVGAGTTGIEKVVVSPSLNTVAVIENGTLLKTYNLSQIVLNSVLTNDFHDGFLQDVCFDQTTKIPQYYLVGHVGLNYSNTTESSGVQKWILPFSMQSWQTGSNFSDSDYPSCVTTDPDGGVYVGTTAGKVYKYDGKTGALIWAITIANGIKINRVAVPQYDSIYCAVANGTVAKLTQK